MKRYSLRNELREIFLDLTFEYDLKTVSFLAGLGCSLLGFFYWLGATLH